MRVADVTAAAGVLAGLAVAAPTPAFSPFEPTYEWEVTNWSASCMTKYGCFYGFDISGPAADKTATAPARPAFKATCAGYNSTGPETDYYECQRTAGSFAGHVTSRLRQPPELLGVKTVAPIEVALIFADPEGQPNTSYNVTGFANSSFNINLDQDPLSFSIKPAFFVGVA